MARKSDSREVCEAKLLARADKTGECWLYTASLNDEGYGLFRKGRERLAHKASYLYFVGPIPAGQNICHKCHVRNCINPAHLRLDTQAANVQEAYDLGRAVAPRGEAQHQAKLTEGAVLAIRARRATGERPSVLAREYGVTAATICDITKRRSWKHLR
jgi:hypothetical protein